MQDLSLFVGFKIIYPKYIDRGDLLRDHFVPWVVLNVMLMCTHQCPRKVAVNPYGPSDAIMRQ